MKNLLHSSMIRTLVMVCVLFSNEVFAESVDALNSRDYQMLCKVYEEVTNGKSDLSSMEMMLAEKVQEKLPVLFNKLYVHVMNADAGSRYHLIGQYAKQQSKVDWECDAALKYYNTEFN